MHNEGFDEAQFSMYNQFPPMMWHKTGEASKGTIGYTPDMTEKKYLVDQTWRPYGYILDIEAKKGGKARETLPPTLENYRKLIEIHQEKALDFIRRKANGEKPFYMAYWPNVFDFMREGHDFTTSNGTVYAQNIERLDLYIGQIIDELEKQGIAENTLVVAMADNGPMTEVVGAFYQVIFLAAERGRHEKAESGLPHFPSGRGSLKKARSLEIWSLYTTFTQPLPGWVMPWNIFPPIV